ncbi:MAG: hypothetical protein OXQ29_01705 [Rhodospirillaceae bacterium]|nr:hypothetical protein [Rhodospirillaceae bacterium]
MAKGNDGNYLQHCVEVEAAIRLRQTYPDGRLHIALTHGMAPFEQIDDSNACKRLLHDALCDAAREPQPNEREIVKAYRASWNSQEYRPDTENLFCELKTGKHYPNSAELLRTVIETSGLSGGITETDKSKHKELAAAWTGPGIDVARSSWRKQLSLDGALGCPKPLDAPWLFSMDPMTYTENGHSDDANLHRSDLELLAPALEGYVDSGQPGIACFFVYRMMGTKRGRELQRQFWAFMDALAVRLSVQTRSFWVCHRGGDRNLAGLLFSGTEPSDDFVPPKINTGRGI